jgi:hypothetical protein
MGGSKIDKRRYRFFLPPVLFGHALKAATTHWVVTTVTVVVVISGASGLVLAHKGAKAPAPSPTACASPVSLSSATWGAMQGGRPGPATSRPRRGSAPPTSAS